MAENYRRNAEGEEQPQFHPVVDFGQAAENHEQYLEKGSLVIVVGYLDRGRWEDDDGNTKYYPCIRPNKPRGVLYGPRKQKSTSQSKGSKAQSSSPSQDEEIPF